MKKYCLIISLIFVLSVSSALAAKSKLDCKLLHSLSDISKYEEEKPLSKVKLNLARGEYDHVQMVVTLPKGKDAIVIKQSNNNGLGVQCRTIEKVQNWDDVLVPAQDRIKASASGVVKLWFTYHAPRTIQPGEYKETITIFCGEEKIIIPVAMTVNTLVLPITPSIPAVFGVRADMFEKILSFPDENSKREAMQEWIEFLLDYRVSPYMAEWLTRQDHAAYSSPWPMDDPKTHALLSDPRFAKVGLPFFKLDDEQLKRSIQMARYQGYYDKGYYYLADEPASLETYQNLDKHAARLHQFDPEANILTTFYCGPKEGPRKDDLYAVFDLWDHHTKIFSMSNWALHQKESVAKKCISLLEDDQEWWPYVCMGPGGKEPNWLLQMTPMQHRAVMWRTWKEQGDGFLYWAVNNYILGGENKKQIAFRPRLPEGDGLLTYPGEYYGTKGPLASIRLERCRDSMEDYEYLKAVEMFKGRQVASDILRKIYQGPVQYTDQPLKVDRFKASLIKTLEK